MEPTVMAYIAGVDVGNNTTEIAIAEVNGQGEASFIASAIVSTVGIKGTVQNAMGVIFGLDKALKPLAMQRKELSLILLNEATPVIGDVAMETITETVITESAMIGHNPSTPGGQGLGVGTTVAWDQIASAAPQEKWILVVPEMVDFREVAAGINRFMDQGRQIVGAVIRNDEGVLIHNRLVRPIPIVDEVEFIDRVPLGMPAAVEVAPLGRTIEKLSNPYDIATIFHLDPDETRQVVPIARALMGIRSAVVIKTPKGDIQERRIPAGTLVLLGRDRKVQVQIEEGAEAIMARAEEVSPLVEIQAETGTNVGGMFEQVRTVMAELTDQPVQQIMVRDVLAVDTFKPQRVLGALAGEYALGNAVGLAAMVETHRLPMQRLARKIEDETLVPCAVGGVEAEMAILGALTTPGTRMPLAILDLGGGSTDAALISEDGIVQSIHLAGAGDMVTLLIDADLGLEDKELSENIKCFPLARVESLFHIRHEDGSVQFFEKALEPKFFGKLAIVTDEGIVPLDAKAEMEKVIAVRRQAKQKVFVHNALRALRRVAPAGNIRLIPFVVLVGGSALDFEIPKMVSDALFEYGVVTGRGNIRGTEGPRNAVATGLVLGHVERKKGGV
jgi:diol dehydratase reactivase alpha subunit